MNDSPTRPDSIDEAFGLSESPARVPAEVTADAASGQRGSTRKNYKTAALVGGAVVVALAVGVVIGTVGGSESSTPIATTTEPEGTAVDPVLPSAEPLVETTAYTCENIVSDVTDMTREQHTGGPLLVGIVKPMKTLVDNLDDPPKNGWIIQCSGKGVWSGSNDSTVQYGYRSEGGSTFVSMEPK